MKSRFATLWIYYLAAPVVPSFVWGKFCYDICSDLSTEEPCLFNCNLKKSCECCFEQNPNQDVLTTGKWFKNNQRVDPKRHRWFRYREIYEPILDNKEKTMIAGVLYTHSQETFKMTVLFPPLYPDESRDATVFLVGSTTGRLWEKTCEIAEGTWHCLVRLDDIPHIEDYTYEVQYSPGLDAFYSYSGLVPQPKEYPRVAALSCFGRDDSKDKEDLKAAVIAQDPDILLLQGDQTYFHSDILYGFLETIYTMSEVTRDIPTIVQMDDHDYGMGDIWGALDQEDDSGAGFELSPCVINAAQELALGHLPDPATKATLKNGISIHYTNLIYGKTDFAILESRKFKNKGDGDSLFGSAQELWVEEWCTSQDHLKVVLLQTPIALLATNLTLYGEMAELPSTWRDSTTPGRDRFMNIMKGCAPLFVSGDQHLGIAVTYDDFDVSECASPAVSNDQFWRLNIMEEGKSHMNLYGMQYTLHKVWNVKKHIFEKFDMAGKTRYTTNNAVKKQRADGFLMVDLDGTTATCEMHSYRLGPEKMWEVKLPAWHLSS